MELNLPYGSLGSDSPGPEALVTTRYVEYSVAEFARMVSVIVGGHSEARTTRRTTPTTDTTHLPLVGHLPALYL